MKKYRITVNGISYEVEVDEVSAEESTESAPAVKTEAPKAAAPAKVSASAKALRSPMPGTILKVNCKKGDKVKKGDVLCVLEAMKMENDIMAPEDAVIGDVYVTPNATVETGAPLIDLV